MKFLKMMALSVTLGLVVWLAAPLLMNFFDSAREAELRGEGQPEQSSISFEAGKRARVGKRQVASLEGEVYDQVDEGQWRRTLQGIQESAQEIHQQCEGRLEKVFYSEEVVDPHSHFFSNLRKLRLFLLETHSIFRETLEEMKPLNEEFSELLESEVQNFNGKPFEEALERLGICQNHKAQLFIESLPEVIRAQRGAASKFRLFVEKAYLDLSVLILSQGPLSTGNAIMAFGVIRATVDRGFYEDRDIGQLKQYYAQIVEEEREFQYERERALSSQQRRQLFLDELKRRSSLRLELIDFLINGF